MNSIDYQQILSLTRLDLEPANTTIEKAFSSDKSRVTFSPHFRRLQQKAQVFALETNASVRSRLTHTLEVANSGSLLSKAIADGLILDNSLNAELKVPFIDITETCCLLHDVGNPPFGHFGEAAIRKWFELHCNDTLVAATAVNQSPLQSFGYLLNDFLHFDGNPQTVRIILKLQNIPGPHTGNGFNLTFSQILSSVKYLSTTNDVVEGRSKKAGYFHSEAETILGIQKALNWHTRFPITYIMEAADDISYCLSDIEDGIEKKIISSKMFFEALFSEWHSPDLTQFQITENPKDFTNDLHFYLFKIKLTRSLIKFAGEIFIQNQPKILSGECNDLLDYHPEAKKALSALKAFSKKYLFRSPEAEKIELAGYKVIFGLLEVFKDLLNLRHEDFALLIKSKDDIKVLSGKKLDYHLRLFNLLPEKYVQAYEYAVLKLNSVSPEFGIFEWYYRAHLVVDYISGMTDTFALQTYRLLNGISL